jgi:Thioredoxin
MSSSYSESTGSVLKKFLPLIIGGVVILALLISGFIFIRSKLTVDEKFDTISTYIRPFNYKVGKSDAAVKFVYLFDYSCSACEANAENMTKLVPEYKDKIEFVYKSFITHVGNGTRNAHASNAAGLQGKYYEYHEQLMQIAKAQNGNVSASEQDKIAKDLGLDVTKFRKDAESAAIENNLKLDQADIKDAIVPPSEYAPGKVRPESTPGIVLMKDGKVVTWWVGVIPLEDSNGMIGVKSRINKLLGQSSTNSSENSSVTTTAVSSK